jgi:hypothetical protein
MSIEINSPTVGGRHCRTALAFATISQGEGNAKKQLPLHSTGNTAQLTHPRVAIIHMHHSGFVYPGCPPTYPFLTFFRFGKNNNIERSQV